MSDFAKWIIPDYAACPNREYRDLAELTAQQHEVLDEYRCSHPLGKAARECTLCLVKRVAKAFKEKYE